MVKTLQLASASFKKQKTEKHDADRISELPDEVLVSILSLMSIKDAARTGSLSRRWKKLWTFVPVLILDYDSCRYFHSTLQKKWELRSTLRPWYVNHVNHVLDLYQCQHLIEFSVRFDLNASFGRDVDRWVRFALERRVQKLKLDFSDFEGFNQGLPYFFPLLSSRVFGSPSCNSLKILELKCVNIRDEVLDYCISNCPFLERLCLVGSNSLMHLRLAGSSLCLKYLELVNCLFLRSVKIDATNLVSFKYTGHQVSSQFVKVPNLVEVSLGGQYCMNFVYNFLPASGFVSQLEKLKLQIPTIKATMEFLQFPVLNHLKELELMVEIHDAKGLRAFISLIKASPSLCRFALQLSWFLFGYSFVRSNAQRVPRCPHQSLKVVELVGFRGNIDLELAVYVIENAILLEKIVIDPRDPFFVGSPWESMEGEEIQAARNCAEMLKTKYLLGNKLLIL